MKIIDNVGWESKTVDKVCFGGIYLLSTSAWI